MVAVPAPIPVTVPPETVATEELLVLQVSEGEAVTLVATPSSYLRLTSVVVQEAVPPISIGFGEKDKLVGSSRHVTVGVYVTVRGDVVAV